MKTGLFLSLICLLFAHSSMGQKSCVSFSYQQEQIAKEPSLATRMNAIEKFTAQAKQTNSQTLSRGSGPNIITIPVVVHILYHYPYENISDAQVFSQIDALNRDYRRRGADTANTPAVFKPLAADCEIEFQLAISDPRRRSTSGIVRKYTPVTTWQADDRMKFNSNTGR